MRVVNIWHSALGSYWMHGLGGRYRNESVVYAEFLALEEDTIEISCVCLENALAYDHLMRFDGLRGSVVQVGNREYH